MIRTVTKSSEDTKEMAAAIASVARAGDVILLAGDLGAGKTTFVQGFGRSLGVDEPITSPTFTLLNHYQGRDVTVFHADVYRLDHLQEIVDLGLPELVDDDHDGIALVEWGDVAEPVLPKDFLEIRIAYPADAPPSAEVAEVVDTEDRRTFEFRPVGASWASRLDALESALARWSAA